MNLKVKMIGLSVGLAISIGAVDSMAAYSTYPGTMCVPANAADASKLGYGYYGVQNNAGTVANVVCAIPNVRPGTVAEPTGVFVTFYDRSDATSVSCALWAGKLNGDPVYTTSINNGAPSTWSSGSTQFWFFPNPPAGTWVWNLTCAIPEYDNGFSHITSIQTSGPG